jgi:renal tumor antigen
MDQYRLESKKGEGTFSEVFMAQSIKNHKLVAIKCMKKKYETIEKVKKLKEIQALKLLSPHEHIIKLIEVLYDEPTGTSPHIQANWP